MSICPVTECTKNVILWIRKDFNHTLLISWLSFSSLSLCVFDLIFKDVPSFPPIICYFFLKSPKNGNIQNELYINTRNGTQNYREFPDLYIFSTHFNLLRGNNSFVQMVIPLLKTSFKCAIPAAIQRCHKFAFLSLVSAKCLSLRSCFNL